MLKGNIDKPELIGLAKYNDSYVGIYELDIKDDTGWINAVGIHENYLGRGLGEKLLENALICCLLLELRKSS
jgi:N-acetylglutamate synthase-like GNAT family acetyltransferase